MPEATCHGVLPWRAPANQRRRILSLRFHIQHGELRPYRAKKGIVGIQDFPEWQQVRAVGTGKQLYEMLFKSLEDVCSCCSGIFLPRL